MTTEKANRIADLLVRIEETGNALEMMAQNDLEIVVFGDEDREMECISDQLTESAKTAITSIAIQDLTKTKNAAAAELEQL